MTLTPYACANCGFWQRWFAVPPSCPVCSDVRNALPEDGWEFLTPAQVEERTRPTIGEVVPGVTEYASTPRFGLDGKGWLIETEVGNVAWECAPHYHPEHLADLRRRGGVAVLGSSHVHGFGALYQLQEAFDPSVVAVGEPDLSWTKAFRVTWPMDEVHQLAPGLVAHRTGGHFPGHTVLYDERRRLLFCGDALKVELSEDGTPLSMSTHKAFHAKIPLSHGDVRRYRAVIEQLDFDAVLTPFEYAKGVTTADVLSLFDHQLSGPPTAASIDLGGLR